MAHKIQIKRGNKADLPVLNDGEMGLCIDTQEVFVGSNGTNIPVGVQTEIVNNLTTTTAGKALDATQGKALAEQISTVSGDVAAHKAESATQNKLGHVKVDGKTIFVNDEGAITTYMFPKDLTGSPGPEFLIAGTVEEGFFGEVPSSELITGDALASECGISQGTSQFSTEPWLKFSYKGEILFVAKKPIRYSISWDAINTANCVYGDSGDKIVVIGGKTYKATLMRALEPTNDPKTVASGSSGAVNHHSEWNRLMCQIHEEAINGSWGYPNNIESDIGILEHSLGSGNQGMYNNADLVVTSGNGRVSQCQEMSTSTSNRLHRGYFGLSNSGNITSSRTNSSEGWRPVLRLIS